MPTGGRNWQHEEFIKISLASAVPVCVWCGMYCRIIIDLSGFPIGLDAFSCTEHLKKKGKSQTLCEVQVRLYQSAKERDTSLSQSCSHDPTVCQTEPLTKQVPPPRCLALRVSRKKVSDNLTGEMRRLHQIINTHTDRRQSVPGEPFFMPKNQLQRRDHHTPFFFFFFYISAPLSRNTFLVHFPCRRCRKPAGYKTNHKLVMKHSGNLHKNVIKNSIINIKYVHRD